MIKLYLSILVCLLCNSEIFSQENFYSSIAIPTELKKDANAVVRLNEVNIKLLSTNKILVSVKRIVSVLNKQGNSSIDAYVHYDNDLRIQKLEAFVFDEFGNEIKKIKKKEFKDVSAVDGGTLYSDSRVKYLEYTPIEYPYTVEFFYETITENTAFIPSFYPLNAYYLSVEKATYTLVNPTSIPIRNKEINFEAFSVKKNNVDYNFFYEANNLNAIAPEKHSPLLSTLTPKVMLSANEFILEGVSGNVENWNDFGKWMYHDLISETLDLSENTIAKINALVKDEKTDIDKAKKIYQFVQDKSRYISVQVGIGGWKPIQASQVDKLGYGDCKGLTNYTMALLNAVGVKSNYSVVFAGPSQKSLELDFASMQGNHVILNLPQEDKDDIWLECTSQELPFGFIGDFTDDRDVLVITSEGGKIAHTKKYTTEESTQTINGKSIIQQDGSLNLNIEMISKGIQYDNKYWLENKTQRDLDKHYKERWDYVNDITINSIDIINDKTSVTFNEKIDFTANGYSNIVGDRMLLVLNSFNKNTYVPKRYKSRQLPLVVKRGFKDTDSIEIHLPNNYSIEAIPGNQNISNKFGSYALDIIKKDENTLIYKREFVVNDGAFSKDEYAEYRNFYKKVTKFDNSKLVLIKK